MSIAFNYHQGLFSEPTRGRRGLVIPYLSIFKVHEDRIW